jgi:hypothetical protein
LFTGVTLAEGWVEAGAVADEDFIAGIVLEGALGAGVLLVVSVVLDC